jgi:Flp pilus assembly protein TadD
MVSEHASHNEGAAYDHLAASLQGLAVEDAIRKIKEFLTTFPSFALAHNDIGVLYHRAGNPTLALAHHEKAARLQPDTILFRKNLADFYAVELGWLEEAVDIYLDVLKRNPRDTEALIALGQLGTAMSGRNTLEAPPICQQIEEQTVSIADPASAMFQPCDELYRKAQELVFLGLLSEALEVFKTLVLLQPESALFQNDLGVLCYKLGDPVSSAMHYEKAVTLEPDNAIYTKNLADLYVVELNRVDDAIYLYLDLLKKYPRDVEMLINIGQICKIVGRDGEARAFFLRALEIEPWNTDARQALAPKCQSTQELMSPKVRPVEELVEGARNLVQQGQFAQARELLEEALASDPQNAVVHNDLGVVAYNMGDLATAQTAYEQAAKLSPLNAGFRKNLADLYFVAAGRFDDAIYIYLDLLREYPRDIEVLTGLAQISIAVGRPDEARAFYLRALEVEPWNVEVRDALQKLV